MPEIKNVVFDFGQVMICFNPDYIVSRRVKDVEDKKLLSEVIFSNPLWKKLDDGTMSSEEFLAEVRTRLPDRLHEIAEKVYYSWIYNIPEIEGMRELAVSLREEYGARLFLLSNISKHFIDHADEIDVISIFEKCIFSAEIGLVKPNMEIYEYLCNTCNILPDETVFVDDNVANIEAAKNFGIHGYLFDGNVDTLKKYFEEIFQTK